MSETVELHAVPTPELVGELVRRARRGAAGEAWRRRCGEHVAAAARAWGVTVGDMFRRTRRRPVPQARWTAFFLLKRAGMSRAEIADLFAMDWTTVAGGLRRLEELMEVDAGAAARVAAACGGVPSEK